MQRLKLYAPAKINLGLLVKQRLENGYHHLDMVMQTIDLYDVIQITPTNTPGVFLTCNRPYLPRDDGNSGVRAAKLFFQTMGGRDGGVSIQVEKRIPVQAGLGGGSADAAGVLWGLNRLWGSPFSMEQLAEMGVKIGADVPFCLVGGTARVDGIGEGVHPLAAAWPSGVEILVVKPPEGISTREAFALYDLAFPKGVPDRAERMDALCRGVGRGDLAEIGHALCNDLMALCPLTSVTALLERMEEEGALGALMTGSGSAVFGLFESGKGAACQKLLEVWYPNFEFFLCHPVPHGPIQG